VGRIGCATTTAIALALAGSGPQALAHGPCGCTGPAFLGERAPEVEAAPGDRLVIMQPAIEIVWNPAARDLRIDPTPEIAHDHVAGVETVTLARNPKPTREVVPVPDVPGGRYLVAIYDGSEGGNHYTWDHVRVAGRRADSSTPPEAVTPATEDGMPWGWLGLAVALGAATGALASRLWTS
jgi:hypothetical protein